MKNIEIIKKIEQVYSGGGKYNKLFKENRESQGK